MINEAVCGLALMITIARALQISYTTHIFIIFHVEWVFSYCILRRVEDLNVL
jgi:hypothetical protein